VKSVRDPSPFDRKSEVAIYSERARGISHLAVRKY